MKPYVHRRLINYYETDAMAIVHHSNHIRIFEESRIGWFRHRGIDKVLWSEEELYFPLIESGAKYLKPLYFDDEIEIRMQVRIDGRRFLFQYAIFLVEEGLDKRARNNSKSRGQLPVLCATGHTVHAMVDKEFKIVKKLNSKIEKVMEAEPWTETWP